MRPAAVSVLLSESSHVLCHHASYLQDKRTMKIGLDLGLGVGKKLNENMAMDHTALKKDGLAEAANKVFTISK